MKGVIVCFSILFGGTVFLMLVADYFKANPDVAGWIALCIVAGAVAYLCFRERD